MACRIPYRIDMLLLECECEMLSEHCMMKHNGTRHWICLQKSSYPDECRQIRRQPDFHFFWGDGCPMAPRDEIVYENLESWETTRVKFMRYTLNLNGDEINRFGLESDSNEGGHMT